MNKEAIIKLINNKNYVEAEIQLQSLILKDPKNSDYNFFFGLILTQKRIYKEAIKFFLISVNSTDYQYDSYFNIAGCHQALFDYDSAIHYYKMSIQTNPKTYEPYLRLASCYRFFNEHEKAILNIKKSIALNPISGSYFLLGNIYREMSNFKDARINFEIAIRLDQNFNNAHIGLANLDIDEGNFENAQNKLGEILIKKDLSKPIKIAAEISLGIIYQSKGEYKDAEKIYIHILEEDPKNGDANYNLAICYLNMQNYKMGWIYHEKRTDHIIFGILRSRLQKFSKPLWSNIRPKKNLLIWGEQGIGDMILYSQFIQVIKDQFTNLTIAVDNKLLLFFRKIFDDLQVIDIDNMNNFQKYEYHLPMGSLGFHFQKYINKNDLKIKQNYKQDNKLLPMKKDKYRIGVSWSSANKIFGHKKSLVLALLKDIFLYPNLEFINLQFKADFNEIKNLEKKIEKKIFVEHHIDCFNDIDGVAQLINTCDYIISVSNSNAHIAGKMGIKTFLILPKYDGKLWYWGENEDNDILWYPSIKPIRQLNDGDWNSCITQLKNEIEKTILQQ